MSDTNQETVRITLPAILGGSPAGIESADESDTVRINLPSRPPSNSSAVRGSRQVPAPSDSPEPSKTPLPAAPSAGVQPPPPPIPSSSSAYGESAGLAFRSSASPLLIPKADQLPTAPSFQEARQLAPKNETARASAVPAALPRITSRTSLHIANETSRADVISMPIAWTLLLFSGAILIIQIWNYFMI